MQDHTFKTILPFDTDIPIVIVIVIFIVDKMKYIDDYTSELTRLRKKLEEKNQEVASLQRELAVARKTIKPQNQQPTRPSTPRTNTPQQTPRNCHFAQPTASSRSKAKKLDPTEPPHIEPPRVVPIRDKEYVYKSGIPLLATPRKPVEISHRWCYSGKSHWDREGAYVAHFANATKASCSRRSFKLRSGWSREIPKRGLRFAPWQKPGPDTPDPPKNDYYWDEGEEYPYQGQVEWSSSFPLSPAGSFETKESVTTAATEVDTEDDKEDDSLWATSRFSDELTRDELIDGYKIDHLATFKLAEKTMGLVQASLLATYPKIFEEEKYAEFIRLGYSELSSKFNFHIPGESLARNGYWHTEIHEEIVKIAVLRNMLCHPHRFEFDRPLEVEKVLQQAQAVMIMIGDEKGAMEVRAVRDGLRDLVTRPLRVLGDLHSLSVLPFAEPMEFDENICGALTKTLETNKSREVSMSGQLKMLTDVATAWATQTSYQYWKPAED